MRVLRLSGKTFGKPRPPAYAVGEPPRFVDEGAAALLGAYHAFLRQHGESPANRVPVGGKPFGENGFGRQLLAAGELAADNVEPDVVSDPPPQGDATTVVVFCHCKFT